MHKTNLAKLINRRRMDKNKFWSGDKIQNGRDPPQILKADVTLKSRISSCNFNVYIRSYSPFCYFFPDRRLDSLCHYTETIIVLLHKHRTAQSVCLTITFWSHVSAVTQWIYCRSSSTPRRLRRVRRTAFRWTHMNKSIKRILMFLDTAALLPV